MKHLFIALVVLLFASGCKKGSLQNAIQGTWELRESWGGWTGVKLYKPGNNNLVIFDEESQLIKKIVNEDTSYALLYKYSLVTEDDCGDNLVLQLKNNDDQYRQRATISHDTLVISDGCIADGIFSSYVRE